MDIEKDHVSALKRAIEIVGSQDALAERLANFLNSPERIATSGKPSKVSQQLVSYWLRSGILLPAEYWPAVEAATDARVTRIHLRPDIFGREHVA